MSDQEDNKINSEICRNIKEARLKKGWTQKEVAEKAGMDANSYAKIEQGRSRPFGVTLAKIIKALGVKPSDIIPS